MTCTKNALRSSAFLVLATALTLAGCNNPFQVGFGDNVDIDRPVVTLDTPVLGSFLRGPVTFAGDASDDVAVTSVTVSFNRGASWAAADYSAAQGRWSYDLDTGTRPNGSLSVMVRVTDNSGKLTTTEELLFTVDNEAPSIFFTFPPISPGTDSEDPAYVPPSVGKNGAIFGTVVDREAIADNYPRIKFWPAAEDEPDDSGWIPLRGEEPPLPSVYDFRYNLPSEQVGEFYMRVTARDVGGQVRTVPPVEKDGYRVVVVSGAPQIAFTEPSQADYVRGTTMIRGTMSHETGNEPVITLRFSRRNDPIALREVTKPAVAVTPDGLGYTWEYALETGELPNETIVAQAFAELGGTTGFDSLVFLVDNAPPTVAVTSPGYLDTVYSQVTIRGTASDNASVEGVAIKVGADDYLVLAGTYNWQHAFDSNAYGNSTHATEWNPVTDLPQPGTEIWRLSVLLRATDAAGNTTVVEHRIYIDQDLDKPTVSILAPAAGSNLAGPVLVTGTAFDADPGVLRVEMQIIALTDTDDPVNPDQVIGNVTPTGDALDAGSWHLVTGTTQWTQEINSNGRLYSVTAPGRAYAGSSLTHRGRLRIRIRAVDLGGKLGNIQELAIRLDETIPSITDISPPSGSYVRGVFNLQATITDDEQIETVQVSNDGGTNYITVYSGGAPTYDLDYEVDTGPGGLNAESQVRNFRILVRDNANYTTINTVVVNIDNYWPDGELVTGTWDPEAMAGSAFQVRGNAWDRDRGVADNQYPVRGIDTIDVYLEDWRGGAATGQFYSLSGGASTSATLEDLGNGQGSRPVVASAGHRIRIDRTHIGSVDLKAIEVDGSDSTWWTRIDSTQLPDGQMRVHYLITDRAGNRTHRSAPGFVRNNPPVIGTVTVGTDLNYDGLVTASAPTERFPYTGARFNARGLLYVSPAISGGNAPTTWQLFDDSDTDRLTPLVLAGNTLDISGYADDDYTFVVRATDNVDIVVETSILVTIDQTDSAAPSVSIEAIPAPADGHVETVSPLNAGRPSVSGTVTMSGTASDNQRISEIRITVPGIGTDVLAAVWVGNPTYNLVDQLAGFTVDSSTITEADGHQVSWSYEWNTASHPNRAALGVAFQASVQDFRSGSPPAVSATRTYDVVPYITNLATGLDSGTLIYLKRSALGSYPVAYSDSGTDTFRIEGYNLAPPTGGVTVGSTALTIEAQDAVSFTWVDVRKNAANSGALTVTTNAVPSINNLNDNGLAQNLEAADFFPDRTDDRYLSVWGLNSRTTWTGLTEAVMRPNTTRTGMDWLFVRNGQRLEFNTTLLTNSWTLLGGDMWRNSNGTLMWIFLHNMNWNSGLTTYPVFGSVQWGKDEVFEDAAFNWHRATRDRLGVGNLSFDGDANYAYANPVMHRYRNLRLITTGANTETSNYVAYFDIAAESRSLVFWSFKTGSGLAPADQVTALADGWTSNLEKVTPANTGANYAAGTNNNVGIRTPFTGVSRVEVTSGGADSEHFSMSWDDANGILYLAYYDETAGRLRLAYNLDPAGTPAAWVTRGTPIDTGAGLFVETTVDPDGGVHLAYFDSNKSNLRYAYLPSYDAADGLVVTRTVDALFTNGMYNSIGIRDFGAPGTPDYRPVISSFSLSYSGTRYAVRVAWPTDAIGSTGHGADEVSGAYTGGWEVMAVPAATAPAQARTFIETDGANRTEGQVVVGYNGGWIEEATLLDE